MLLMNKRRIIYGTEDEKFWISVMIKNKLFFADGNWNVFKDNGFELYINNRKIL